MKFPIYTSKWCRTRQASINSAIVLIFFSLSNLHLLIFVQGDDEKFSANVDAQLSRSTVNPFQYQRCYLHPDYVYFFEQIYTWIDMFLVTIIPFLFIILCNLTVINRVFLVSRTSKKHELVIRSKATTRLRSLCLVMICSSFVFVATTLPVTAFIIDLLSNKASIDLMRCRRIQWTIYNILMYYNYASILTYCLSGTEFRQVLMKTIHMRSKTSFASMFNTDVNNIVNQRRISTPQQSNRLFVEYSTKERFRSLSVSLIPTIKINRETARTKPILSNGKFLDVQPAEYKSTYRHSCTTETNCAGLTPSSTNQQNMDRRWQPSYLSTDKKNSLDGEDRPFEQKLISDDF